jgi:hypothetical protein
MFCVLSGLGGLDVTERLLNKMTMILWVITIGFAWLLAFALQYLGERCGLLKQYPFDYYKEEKAEKDEKTASFIITKRSLKNLKSKDVPDDVLKNLKRIKNKKVKGKGDFQRLLNETIGKEQTVEFESVILKHAETTWGKICKFLRRKIRGFLIILKGPHRHKEAERKEFHEKWARFHDIAKPHERVHAERFNVIKEACGNGAVSIACGLAISLFGMWHRGKWGDLRTFWPFAVLALILAFSLWRMHIIHIDRYGLFVGSTIGESDQEKNETPRDQ